MRDLHPGYSSAVDVVEEAAWCRILEQFDDANIYQTWPYDEVRCGRANISHLVLRKNGDIVAAAQARIVKAPLLKVGIAYVRWGPLWRRREDKADPEIFRQAIRALRNEYACRRGLVLRFYPSLFSDESSPFLTILEEEGFSAFDGEKRSRTLLLDVSRPLEKLRAGLRPHWHRYLKVAERNELEIVEGSEDELFEEFVKIYREMVARKRFAEPNDIDEFRRIQRRLPEKLKMKIMLCRSGGEVCAGLVCSSIGNTAVYLFGATSDAGLKKRGSYLLHWRLIEWLSKKGRAVYDLNGIDPVVNTGTYKFKTDLCGNNSRDVYFLGRFDSYTNVLSHACVASGDSLRRIYRVLRKNATERAERAPVMTEERNGVGVQAGGRPTISAAKPLSEHPRVGHQPAESAEAPSTGLLILNADDWGRDRLTTDRTLECTVRGAVSSVSAMVFMEDSERAAALARERRIEAGLHLNFTTAFSASGCPARLLKRQQEIGRHLLRHRLAQVVLHPGLARSFEYVVAAQLDEFRRIYGADPERLDGHHHMHLCENVLFARLLPPGTIVRRNFSFERREKSPWNRLYRQVVDRRLARRHRLVDFFFSLPPLEPSGRLDRIFARARKSVVEVETHPVEPAEYRFLIKGEIFRQIGDVRIAPPSAIPWRARSVEGYRS
jgi:hypothetical protein